MILVRGANVLACVLVIGVAIPVAQASGASCARPNDDRLRPIPQSLAARARQALGLAAAMTDADLVRTTVYRCMDGVAWVCNHGANLSCAKANVSRVSLGANAWCKANPGSSDVPAYATGHETVFSWTCAGSRAVVGHAIPVDERGFAADQWKPIRE